MMRVVSVLLILIIASVAHATTDELLSNTANVVADVAAITEGSKMELQELTAICPATFNGAAFTSSFPMLVRTALLSNIAYDITSTASAYPQVGVTYTLTDAASTQVKIEYKEFLGDTSGWTYGNGPWMIASDSSFIYVVFRGSSSARDFLTDSRVTTSSFSVNSVTLGNVHDGFQSLYGRQSNVVSALQTVRNAAPNKKVVFTGHSLGAAMAVLHGIAFSVRNNIVPEVYTFGCPRPGDQTFANNVISRTHHIRVKNLNDPVTLAPQTTLLLARYFHGADVSIRLLGSAATTSPKYRCVTDENTDSWFLLNINDHSVASGYIPNLRLL